MAVGSRRRRPMSEINVVPYIDVMLVLLIIFMVTAPLITPSVIDLPSVGKAARQPDKVIQLVLARDASIELKADGASARLALGEVAAAVRRAQGEQRDTAVVISADRTARYEQVVALMDTLQKAGVQRIGLSVQLAP